MRYKPIRNRSSSSYPLCVKFRILFSIAVLAAAAVRADEGIWAARPLSLGGAYIGVADDAYAPFSNPAGLAQIRNDQAAASFGRPSGGKPDLDRAAGSFSYVDSSSQTPGTFGFWWTYYSTASVTRENVMAFSFGRDVYHWAGGQSLAAGVNIKYLNGLSLSGPRTETSSLGGDLGLLFFPNDSMAFGLVAQDVNRPRVALSGERRPAILGLGGSYWVSEDVMLAADVLKRNDESKLSFRGGLETWALSPFALRVGGNDDHLTFGAGYVWKRGEDSRVQGDLEYAYAMPQGDDVPKIHMLSLRLRFGGGEDDRSRGQSARTEKASQEEDFALLQKVSAMKKSALVLGPEDVLEIKIRNHPELDTAATVDSWGYIKLPYIGELYVNGLKKERVEEIIMKIYSEFFVEPPDVEVVVTEYNSRVVYVLGEVRSPGKYPLQDKPLTLRDAVVLAGLPTQRAATWRVFVVRQEEGEVSMNHVNLYNVLMRGDLTNNMELQSGDVVVVPMTLIDTAFNYVGRVLGPIFGYSGRIINPVGN